METKPKQTPSYAPPPRYRSLYPGASKREIWVGIFLWIVIAAILAFGAIAIWSAPYSGD